MPFEQRSWRFAVERGLELTFAAGLVSGGLSETPHPVRELGTVLVGLGLMLGIFRVATTKLTITSDCVVVRNVVRIHTIPLSEVTRIDSGLGAFSGLKGFSFPAASIHTAQREVDVLATALLDANARTRVFEEFTALGERTGVDVDLIPSSLRWPFPSRG
jgi:hypothetical protein